MTVRVFIIDDMKPIKAALAEGRFWNGFHWEPSENDPKEIQVSIARTWDDGFDIIRVSEPFDVWLVDGDLGMGHDGLEFMKMALERYPDKVPEDVRSCSANSFSKTHFGRHVDRLRKMLKVPDVSKKSAVAD